MYAAIHAPGIAASGIAEEFSPAVERVDPALVVFDVRGLERLMGSPRDIAAQIAARAGPEAGVALAATPATAALAARARRGVTVIPPGEEARRLADWPVDHLPASGEVKAVLAGWGVRTLGELARLPEAGLAARLGAEGVRLQRLARGEPAAPLRPEPPAEPCEAALEFDHPVELLEPLSFGLSRLLHEVCLQLQNRGLAALELHLALRLDGGARHERSLRLPVPMRDPLTFLKLLQLDLQARPTGRPITAVRISVTPAEPRPVQAGLFLPPAPEAEKLELTLRRLAALVGPERVGSPQLVDTYRPGAFRTGAALAAPASLIDLPPGQLAFRAFRPPLAAAVTPAEGPPRHLAAGSVRGAVLACAGPWRTSGDWWTSSPWARDDFDLALAPGGLYRVYRDAFTGRWFLDGSYD